MPIIRNNPAVAGASGMLGQNFVYRRLPNGETLMANKPSQREGLSEEQKVVVNRFSDATYYAKKITKKTEFKELYKRGINKEKLILSAYNVAIKDFLNLPVVEAIDVKDYSGEPGQLIRARATDDFKVMSVSIVITDSNNQVIEKGEAIARGKRGLWRYTTTVRNLNLEGTVITVEAKDVPGHTTREQQTILRVDRAIGLMVTGSTIRKKGDKDTPKDALTIEHLEKCTALMKTAATMQKSVESKTAKEALAIQHKEKLPTVTALTHQQEEQKAVKETILAHSEKHAPMPAQVAAVRQQEESNTNETFAIQDEEKLPALTALTHQQEEPKAVKETILAHREKHANMPEQVAAVRQHEESITAKQTLAIQPEDHVITSKENSALLLQDCVIPSKETLVFQTQDKAVASKDTDVRERDQECSASWETTLTHPEKDGHEMWQLSMTIPQLDAGVVHQYPGVYFSVER